MRPIPVFKGGFDDAKLTDFDKTELAKKAAAAGLPWHFGNRQYGSVVSDVPTDGHRGRGWDHGYTGVLIAESMAGPSAEYLVLAATAVPALLREVEELRRRLGPEVPF